MALDHHVTLGRSGLRVIPVLGPPLNESTYTIVDELQSIARAYESPVARVSLAWVQAQPGVTSTIIGARRLRQPAVRRVPSPPPLPQRGGQP